MSSEPKKLKPEELEGHIKNVYKLPFYYDADSQKIFDQEGMILDVRSWGRLTGTGGHNLPEWKAIQIQDELGRRTAKILNEHWLDKPQSNGTENT